LTMNLESLFNNFLTSGMGLAEPETTKRIKFLNLFELAFIIIAPFLGLFYFYVGAFFLFYSMVIAGLFGIGVLILLRFTKNPGLAGNLAVFIFWSVLIVIRWNSGGISSGGLIPLAWVWNGVVILLAIYMTGFMWGTVWSCLVFMESGLAVFLFRAGHDFTNLIPMEIAPVYSLGAYLLGLLFVLLLAFLYRNERDYALSCEASKSRMLRDSAKYTERVLERLPIATFVLDNNHRVVQWNRACQEMTGIEPGEIIGKRVWEGFYSGNEGSLADQLLDDPDVLPEKYADSIISMSDSGNFTAEMSLPKLKSGARTIINTAPIIGEDGSVRGAIQTIQSMGDEIAKSRPGSGPGEVNAEGEFAYPVFKIGANGNISAWNKSCEDSFGYSVPSMMEKSPLLMVSKAYRNNFREAVMKVFDGEAFPGKEWKYYNSDGRPVYVLARMYPVRNSSGKVQECVVFNDDITDLKLRLKKLGRSALESRERLKQLSEDHELLKRNIASFIRKKEE